jgi:hyperosmotically inducible protein
MNSKFNSLKGLLAIFTLILAGFAVMTSSARAKPVGNDAKTPLAAQVKHKLAMLSWYGVFDNLKFQVNGNEVVLSGYVTSGHGVTKDDAEKLVGGIGGVTKVVNDIQILPPSSFDDQIRRAEYRAIFSEADLGKYTMGAIPPVHIVVDNGHVTLEGTVMNQMDRNIAGLAANTVPGVFSVTNNLQIGG